MNKWLIACLLLFPIGLFAQNEALQQIKAVSQNVRSIETDFVQTKHISFMDEALVSKGKLFFKRPDKMRWEYTDPFSYAIVINGDGISILDDQKVKHYDASANMLFGRIKEVIMNMVNGKMFDDSDYHTTIEKTDGLYKVHFETVNPAMKDYIASIDLFFTANDYQLSKIRMNEASGDDTVVKFTNRRLNQPVADSCFTLNH